jgi:hypothetical protein
MPDSQDTPDQPGGPTHGLAMLYRALQTTLPADRSATLHQRLATRVLDSAARHRGYLTVRREQAPWQPRSPGVRGRLLRESGGLRAELLQLQAGALLPTDDAILAQEVLVVQGTLQSGTAPALGPQAYLVRQRGEAPGAWQATEAATVFLRSWQSGCSLPALEADWWQIACRKPLQLPAGRRPWVTAGPGVQIQALCGDSRIVSMLVRFAAGASVPDHDHAVDEDCLMLAGEMYLGDVLLRPLDYQMAPAGLGHFGETSEPGGLFFFHGALDPVLLPPG